MGKENFLMNTDGLNISTEYLQKCIDTLEKSYIMFKSADEDTIEYEMYRNSFVKSFEMTIEQSAKLLRKKLCPYFPSKKAADMLTFKDIFRYAHKHSLLTSEETERWFILNTIRIMEKKSPQKLGYMWFCGERFP